MAKKISIADRIVGAVAGAQSGGEMIIRANEAHEEMQLRVEDAEERTKEALGFGDLELSMEDAQWRELTGFFGKWNFTRAGIRRMVTLSRIMYIINPLIKRAVTVQELYVWGSGVKIKAKTDELQEVLDDFFNHEKNQSVIGNSFPEREREQRNDGNTFFVLFRNKYTGAVRVRLLQIEQIEEIVFNPEDIKEPWFYKRSPASGDIIALDFEPAVFEPAYYPDILYNPTVKPKLIKGVPVRWDQPVIHVKTGGLSQMRFGLPELFSALNWATAYKAFLENFATIMKAYARVAMKLTGNAGKSGVAAAKTKLGTAIAPGNAKDTNPPPNVGSIMPLSGNVDISAVKTAGSTTGPDEARALRSMVAAGSDTPEHFFGDSDIGNFATSTTLDRPTELKMIARQNFWAGIIGIMANYVIQCSTVAPFGKLRRAGYKSQIKTDIFDGTTSIKVVGPTRNATHYSVEFPQILERNVTDRVSAVVKAVTLGGSPAEGIIPDRKVVCELLVEALGIKDGEERIGQLYPDSINQGCIDPAKKFELDKLTAMGKKELGDAALIAANAKKDQPAPSGPTGD